MRRRSIVAFVAAILMFAAGAPAALGSHPDRKAIWGPLTVKGKSEFPVYRNLGVGIYEMSLSWVSVAPTRPKNPRDAKDPGYRWGAGVSYAIQQAARYHMRILLQVSQTPSWANGGRAANYPPAHPVDLANFMAAAAHRYHSVRLWMIWGEPNRKPNWATLVGAPPRARTLNAAQAAAPHLYARMLDASFGALKSASRQNLVIGGDTYTTGDISTPMWIKYLRLPNGKPPRMDLYGHNPFSFRAPNLGNPPSADNEFDFSDLLRLSRLVKRQLSPSRHVIKLFLSEWTIPTAASDSEFNYYVTPAVQAEWIRDAWRIVRRSRFIYALGWVHLYDDLSGGSAGGLLYQDGTPKPGYYAFRAG